MPRHDNALDMLRQEHKQMQALFHRFESSSGKEEEQLCREMVDALKAHTRIEEEVFYPYLREATDRLDLVEEASVEHGAAKQLLADLESGADGVHRRAVVKVLGEYVGHHIREEEEKIFPLVENIGVDLDALGEEMAEHRQGGSSSRSTAAKASNAKSAAAKPARESYKGDSHARPSGARARAREDDETFLESHSEDLSPSTQRAKWIHEPGEEEDHPGQTLATRNPEVIQAWAEERRAIPATTPGGDLDDPRVLRFDFPDYDKGLQHIEWDAWLRTFDERELVFVFQQRMKAGNQSNFFRLDSPHREEG